uniref:F-box domain-containing protein n=1 Tax=Mycena chlorophos TaxID=658473 RepID=A0ABQ0LTT2_MYCCL|nr:predicted protein [Mycena chlorophos]
MHRCLQIPEIVHEVIHHIDTADRHGPGTLFALALTCRRFEEPALDRLWEDPGPQTLRFIIKCFPADALRTQFSASRSKVFVTIKRPITLADWDRPLKYCTRVRRFHVESDTLTRFADVLYHLSIALPRPWLFPRLRFLRWSAVVSREMDLEFNLRVYTEEAVGRPQLRIGIQYMKILLSPSVERLELHLSDRFRSMISALPVVVAQANPVTHLSLVMGKLDTGEGAALSAVVRSLPANHLRALEIPFLDTAALRHVARLGGLTTLKLASFDKTFVRDVDRDVPFFPALQTFSVLDAHIPSLSKMLGSSLHKSHLRNISVGPTFNTTTEEISALSDAFTLLDAGPLRTQQPYQLY